MRCLSGFCCWLLLMSGLGAAGFRTSPRFQPQPLRGAIMRMELAWQRGDNPAWASPDFDDSGWPRIARIDLPSRDGIYWIRFRVHNPEPDWVTVLDSVSLSIVASYDLYWDGHLLGRNGRVGRDREDEVPGFLDNVFRVPDDLSGPGEHLVAMRMSSFRTGFSNEHYSLIFRVHSLRDVMLNRARTTAFMMVATGGALVVGLVFGLMWLLADRRPALGLFGAICLAAGVEQALQAWRWLANYPYDWHYPRLVAITAIVAGIGLLLTVFLQTFFGLKRGGWQILIVLIGIVLLWNASKFYDANAVAMSGWALAMGLAIALRAWRQKRRGAGVISIGLVISLGMLYLSPVDFLEQSFVFSSGGAMLGCVIALTLQLRDDRRASRQAQLAASRLEVELLKKNIQPHFLLNTLATIQETIEQEPRTATELIDALASEFRIVNRMSGEKLVTLAQEIELCRAHLRVMSRRKAAQCSLTVLGGDERALVPPAVFLTLIENGLTHLLPRDGRLDFTLRVEMRAESMRYTLLAEGVRQSGAQAHAPVAEGTGLRYIKARLEESFTGRWSLTAGPVLEGWETVIEIRPNGVALRGRSEASGTPPLSEEKPA